MRNLKKVLALVLAVVMIFGVMSLTSATFTDDAKVSNTEAVEVMAGLQILTGYTDGSYQPAGNVTREEMATIICKMLLGPEVAKTLTQGTSNFKDVAANRWSAGYIEYCANLGIIDGYGDGTFNPAGNVTIGEAAKMLLVAAGIKGTYTGADWLVNVTANATKAGILPTTVDVRATATRDQVALYAFNALNYTAGAKTYVYNVYNTMGTDDTSDDVLLATYTDAASAYFYAQSATAGVVAKYVAVATITDDTMGYKVFKLRSESTFDMYGRPATRWYRDFNNNKSFDSKVVFAGTAYASEQLYFYTNPATQVFNTPIDAPAYSEMVAAYQAQGYTIKHEGATVTAADASALASCTGYSNLVEFYANPATRTVTIVCIPEYVAKVIMVVPHTATALKGAYTEYALDTDFDGHVDETIVIYSSHVKAGIEEDTGTVTGTVTAGSIVTFTSPDRDRGATWIDAQVVTNTVSGVVTTFDAAARTLTINGTAYHIAECLYSAITANFILYGQTGTFYLDQYGNIAYADFTQAVNYAQINFLQIYDSLTYVNGTYSENALRAQLVFEDGTTKVVNVAAVNINTNGLAVPADVLTADKIKAGAGTTYTVTNSLVKNFEHNVVTYTVDETTGAYTLFTFNGATEDVIEAGKAIQPYQYFVKGDEATYLANAQTKFIVRTGADARSYKWTVYTGYATLPALSSDHTCVAAIDKNNDNYADLVYIVSEATAFAVNDYVYVTGAPARFDLLGNGLYVATYPTADGKGVIAVAGGQGQLDTFEDQGLYHITKRTADGVVITATLIEDSEFACSYGYTVDNGLQTKNAVWSVLPTSKLVFIKDNKVVDGATWTDIPVCVGTPGEYAVEVYVVADTVNEYAIGTAYVVATLIPQP